MKNILLIGDSIRQGYDRYVKKAFSDVANVYYPGENCRFSTYVIRNLYDWVDEVAPDVQFDLIHWNAGLWDDLCLGDGLPLVRYDEYCRNIERICKLIKIRFPNAKTVFATSTPIDEERPSIAFKKNGFSRKNADTEMYNKGACEIALSYGAVINDLYTLMKDTPKSYHSDRTHFYTKEGTRVITDHTIKVIEDVLKIKANPLDYDALFTDTEALGI